jgi:hypothetical protein
MAFNSNFKMQDAVTRASKTKFDRQHTFCCSVLSADQHPRRYARTYRASATTTSPGPGWCT